jgi:hypothetical protein
MLVDFPKVSKIRKGFCIQQRQDQYLDAVGGDVSKLPLLNITHCQQAWRSWTGINLPTVEQATGLAKGTFLARGLALKGGIESINDVDFGGFSAWSNYKTAEGYTHAGWYGTAFKTVGFMPGCFVILIVDASSSDVRFVAAATENPQLADQDNWVDGETILYIPKNPQIKSISCFSSPYGGEKTWIVRL